jgi:hypothetical protein
MIRAATLADVPRLVAMGRAFLATPPYAGLFADDPEQLAATVTALITGALSTVLVVERGDSVVGMIGLLATPHFLTRQILAGEVMWWIEPAARGSAGVRLLKAGERWAAERGAVAIQLIHPITAPRVGQLYTALGYVPLEQSYIRRLDHAA